MNVIHSEKFLINDDNYRHSGLSVASKVKKAGKFNRQNTLILRCATSKR